MTIDESRMTNSRFEERSTEQVASILDSIADFSTDREFSDQQVAALDSAFARPPAKVLARDLPIRVKKPKVQNHDS